MAETVTIERAEYERLLDAAEILEDVQAYDRAMTELDRDALLPDAFMARLLDGESPLKVYREWREFSVAGLGRLTGVNRIQIHDIEAGRSRGSALTLRLLANHLRVDIEDLLAD
jgi:DNA-binding XRE family transcriptional regulator